jgi:hypothetical protein
MTPAEYEALALELGDRVASGASWRTHLGVIEKWNPQLWVRRLRWEGTR